MGLGRGFRGAWLWLSLTLARLCPYCFACWCYFVPRRYSMCPGVRAYAAGASPRMRGPAVSTPVWALAGRAWSAPRPHELPSFLVPRVRLLAHRVVLLCHANWISTTSFAGYSRIAALYRYLVRLPAHHSLTLLLSSLLVWSTPPPRLRRPRCAADAAGGGFVNWLTARCPIVTIPIESSPLCNRGICRRQPFRRQPLCLLVAFHLTRRSLEF